MKSFNELRNEINEVEKKKPCTDCEKKEKAAAKKKAKELNAFLQDEGEDTQKAGPQGVNH